MPILDFRMNQVMIANLTSKAIVGPDMPKLTGACSTGTIMSIVGKPFTTTDSGSGGPGVGTGLGIIGITAAELKTTILANAVLKGLVGENTPKIISAYADALELELAQVTLTSSHPLVAVGAGVIDVGSIPVTPIEIEGNITSQGVSKTLVGENLPKLSNAMAQGVGQAFRKASGNVVIAGTPIQPPAPATGKGQGTVS